ncbi:MAG TPA: DNA polymerase III subunit delta, partial [Pseudomonadales bacterium]|nr:DNA polymerase III subunit delta [Pseudomonadales bacterium]
MKLKREQLDDHLRKGLSHAYLVNGDEPLLLMETCDAIREAARQKGFLERELMVVETGFDWSQLQNATETLSLFGERKIVELKLPNGKPGEEGTRLITQFVSRPCDDTLLLVVCDRLDKSAKSSKWAKAMEEHGVAIDIWPLDSSRLPAWIADRARKKGLQITQDGAVALAEHIEGNLLAAAQEIEKLVLLAGDQRINAELINQLVADHARFDAFGMVDAAYQGNLKRSLRMLSQIQLAGEEPLAVLGAMTRELRLLLACLNTVQNGGSLDKVFQERRIFDRNKMQALKQCCQRLNLRTVQHLLVHAANVDRAIK